MINSIQIENFKGIRNRLELQLKPLTLLFGSNSSGKSTIVQAFHYAREVFERHNLDPDQTLSGGRYIDLGGFGGFVHQHDKKRSVTLRIDLSLDDEELPSFDPDFAEISRALETGVETFIREVRTAAVEVVISWSHIEQQPYVSAYRTFIDGRLFAEITGEPNRRRAVVSQIALDHPVLTTLRDVRDDEEGQETLFDEESLLSLALSECGEVIAPGDGRHIQLVDTGDALRDLDEPLEFEFGNFSPAMPDPMLYYDDDYNPDEKLSQQLNMAPDLVAAISQLVVGPGQLVRRELQQFRYLGPLRETPPRNFTAPRHHIPARWASGAAAWDELHSNPALVEEVSDWLSRDDRLNASVSVRLKQYKELDIESPLMVLLNSDRAFDELEDIRDELENLQTQRRLTLSQDGVEVMPLDVGVGISQLIPVVVMALDDHDGLSAIEQPELHIHPAVQVNLGDLLIQQISVEDPRRFLIETHSEHLVLRLLRRIRETTDGDLPADHPGLHPEQVSVVFLEQTDEGVQAHSLRIDETGEFVDRWPKGFFEERAEELF